MDSLRQTISCCRCKEDHTPLLSDPGPVQEQFQLLQTSLNSLRLPATVPRCQQQKPQLSEDCDVTVVLLAELKNALKVFLDGERGGGVGGVGEEGGR